MKSLSKIRNRDEFRPFNLWINDLIETELNPRRYGFSFNDLDGILFADRKTHLLWFLLEVKTYATYKISSHQICVMNLFNAIGKKTNGQVIDVELWRRKGSRKLVWLGFHLLVLSATTPDNSDWMEWDRVTIHREDLIKVLRFEHDPRNPRKKLVYNRTTGF